MSKPAVITANPDLANFLAGMYSAATQADLGAVHLQAAIRAQVVGDKAGQQRSFVEAADALESAVSWLSDRVGRMCFFAEVRVAQSSSQAANAEYALAGTEPKPAETPVAKPSKKKPGKKSGPS